MQKRSRTILITVLTAIVVFGLVIVLGSRIRAWVADNVFEQYVAQEAVIADQVAGDLEYEIASVRDKLEIAALIPEIHSATNSTACTAKLAEVLEILGSRLGNLGRINAQGVFACSVNKALVGAVGSKLGSYVTDIFNDPKHEPVMSHTILPPGATYAVALHVPVYTASGQFDGTLGGAVYLKDLRDKFLKHITFAKNGFAILFDENGDILFHPNSELIGQNVDSAMARENFSNIEGLKRAVADAKAGNRGKVRYELDGVEKVGAYRPAKVLPNHNWVVMATVPVADASDLLAQVGVDQAFLMENALQGLAIAAVALVLVIGTLKEIRLQEKLRLEKAKAHAMLSSIGDGVMAIDGEGKIGLLNMAAAVITGWREQDALGRPWREVMKLIRERDRKDAGGFVDETLRGGKSNQMPKGTLLVRHDGSEVPVGDSAAPIFDSTGGVTGAIVVFRDMTDEIEASRMKSDFAYASHQFRTPLTQAMAAISLAKDEKDATHLQDDLEMAQVGVSSAHRLALKLLSMADVDNDRVRVRLENVNIPAVVKEARTKVGEYVAADQVIRTRIAKDLKQVRTDPELLKQIMTELLFNAVDYGAGKPVRLEAELQGRALVIGVRNVGAPISEEDQAQIFTRFFRGANRPADLPGAGLGLYLVREYAQLLRGKVWFESGEKGTTFWVSVPTR